MITGFIGDFKISLSFFPVEVTIKIIEDIFDRHQDEIEQVKSSWVDRFIITVFEYFMGDAGFIGFLIVFSKDKYKTYNGANQSPDIGEVIINFIELPGVCDGLPSSHYIKLS